MKTKTTKKPVTKMDNKTFFRLQEKLFDDCVSISKAKGEEYTIGSGQKFDNFERTAAILGLDRSDVVHTFLIKHLQSILYYKKYGKEASDESIRGRYIDAINYLVLDYGMIWEDTFLNND